MIIWWTVWELFAWTMCWAVDTPFVQYQLVTKIPICCALLREESCELANQSPGDQVL